jgi:hypothetical protein
LDDTDLVRLLRIILHLLIGMRILLGLVIETIVSLLRNLFLYLISSKSSKVSSSVCHSMAHVAHWDLFLLAVQIVQEWILDLRFMVLVIHCSTLWHRSCSLELIMLLLNVAIWLLLTLMILHKSVLDLIIRDLLKAARSSSRGLAMQLLLNS